MSRIGALWCSVLLLACAPSGEQASSAADTAAAAPAAISLADVAGTWNMETAGMESDSIVMTSQFVATDGMEGWAVILPERDPVPVRVLAVDADSIVAEYGPFPSVRREGLMVTVQSVIRLRDSTLMSRLTAHYQQAGADSVAMLRSRGTRVK
jgi:hypothetical protein